MFSSETIVYFFRVFVVGLVLLKAILPFTFCITFANPIIMSSTKNDKKTAPTSVDEWTREFQKNMPSRSCHPFPVFCYQTKGKRCVFFHSYYIITYIIIKKRMVEKNFLFFPDFLRYNSSMHKQIKK